MADYLRWGSLVLYLVTFPLPVFRGDDSPGILAFLLGMGVFPAPWFANIAYLVAVFLKKKKSNRDLRLFCSVAAIGFACFTFAIHELPGIGSESDPAPVSPGLGFWLWFSSFIVLFAGVLVGKFIDKEEPKMESEKEPPPMTMDNPWKNSGLGH